MFPTPYVPPKPEHQRSITANRMSSITYALFGAWSITGLNAMVVAGIPSAIKDIAKTYATGNSLEATLTVGLGVFAFGLIQVMNVIGIYGVKDMIEDEEKDIKIKKTYRNAILNKDTNLVYKLEQETPYLTKWGKKFIKNYETIKPTQLSLSFDDSFKNTRQLYK